MQEYPSRGRLGNVRFELPLEQARAAENEVVTGTPRIVLERVAVGRQQEEFPTVDLGLRDAGVGDERAGVVHCQLDLRPCASAVGRKGGDEVGFLAVLVGNRTPHCEAPDDVLPGRTVEDRIGVGELDRPPGARDDRKWRPAPPTCRRRPARCWQECPPCPSSR